MEKLLPYVTIAFMVIAMLVDFTSKFLSILVDGVLLSVPIAIYFYLARKKSNEENNTNRGNSRK